MCFSPRMNLRIAALAAIFTLGVAPSGKAGGKAEEIGKVTFHLQTDEGSNPKMIFSQTNDGKPPFFLRSPEITMKDIVAFRPFPSGMGEEFGVVFQLKDSAKRHLAVVSISSQGKYLLAQANGRFVDCVMIDGPVEDGFIVIWKGLTLEEVKLFDKAMPRIGDDGKGKKKKKTK